MLMLSRDFEPLEIGDVAASLSDDASAYAWHLIVWGRTYSNSKYYDRALRNFCKVLALQLGCDALTVEMAVIFRNLGKTDFDSCYGADGWVS